MTKRQLIEDILTLNRTAEPAFLARFDDSDLHQYLDHLRVARAPRLSGDTSRYAKYFASSDPNAATPPTPVAQAEPWQEADRGPGDPDVSTPVDAAERAALLDDPSPADLLDNAGPTDEYESSDAADEADFAEADLREAVACDTDIEDVPEAIEALAELTVDEPAPGEEPAESTPSAHPPIVSVRPPRPWRPTPPPPSPAAARPDADRFADAEEEPSLAEEAQPNKPADGQSEIESPIWLF